MCNSALGLQMHLRLNYLSIYLSQILYFYLAPSKSPQNLGHCWPGVVLQGGIGHIWHFFAQSLFHNPIHQITIDFDFVFFLLHISSDYILVCWPH